MPDDTVHVLYCLVQNASSHMKIKISVDDDVDDLREIVHNLAKNSILLGTDIVGLSVWQLKKQVFLEPHESLGERVLAQGPLSSFAVNLAPTARIGDIFPVQPKLGLHIIVKHVRSPAVSPSSSLTANLSSSASSAGERPPAASHKRNVIDIGSHEEGGKRHKAVVDDGPYAKFGFERLSYDGTLTDEVLHFYKSFWGVPLPQEHIRLENSIHEEENAEEDGEENDSDVLPATPPSIIDTPWVQVFIRAEYLRMYEWVEGMYEAGRIDRPSAIVVTGQPGIGKSFWAYYVLRRRLGEKSVSLWYQGSVHYLFCSEGVLLVPASFTFNKFKPRVWTIIHSAQSSIGIPTTMTAVLPGVFPIYLTSPKSKRWSGISQSWASNLLIMNPWTRAEIESAYHSITLYSHQSLDTVLKRFDTLGPTARLCFGLTPSEIERHTNDRHESIEDTTPDQLQHLFLRSSRLSLGTLSHKICLIRRKRGSTLGAGIVTTAFMSAEAKQEVVQRLEKFSDDQLLDVWNNFSKFGDARGMTGPVFEVFVHRHFRTHISLDAQPMVQVNCANARWHASFSTKRPQSATVYGVAQEDFSLQVVVGIGKTFVYNTGGLNVQPDLYYVPRSGQQVALDSFILHGGYLNVFQCTGGHGHDVKRGMDDFLNSCSGLPPRANWCFVFVVPDDLESFSSPASSFKDLGFYTARFPMSKETVTED